MKSKRVKREPDVGAEGDSKAPLSSHCSKSCDPDDLSNRNDQMFVVAADAELGTPPDVLLLGRASRRGIVHSDIQQMHPALILAVVPAHIGQGPLGLEHDRDPVQLCVPRMENVTRHHSVKPWPRRTDRTRP
jgi:hypothetical protein